MLSRRWYTDNSNPLFGVSTFFENPVVVVMHYKIWRLKYRGIIVTAAVETKDTTQSIVSFGMVRCVMVADKHYHFAKLTDILEDLPSNPNQMRMHRATVDKQITTEDKQIWLVLFDQLDNPRSRR
jgi:hypothetical protein